VIEENDIGVGTVLGGFQIEREIGRGGMGIVYKAHELSLNRKVALKVLSKRLSFDESFVKRFQREAQIVAALNHPNIVNILSYGVEKGQRYFAMEYIQGRDLGQILTEKPLMAPEEALSIIAQVASALDEASARGIVHRDLKPANIMVGEMGRVKVTDFGVAHFQGAETKMTRTGLFLGTPEYASPEQIMGEMLDVRCDIYSLGAVLYKILSGEPPVVEESPLAVIAKIATEPVRPIEEVNPSVPKPLCELIGKMMARKPGDRFQSPKEVLAAIDECANALKTGAPLVESRVADAVKSPPVAPKKTSYGKILGGALGVALAILLIIWIADSATRRGLIPKTYEPSPHPMAAGELLVKGQFVPGPNLDKSSRLAGGVVRSNISDPTTISPTGHFQFNNAGPVESGDDLHISAVLHTEDKRMFRPKGGSVQRSLEDVAAFEMGEIPLEPYEVRIEDIPVNVVDWAGAPIPGEEARVMIGQNKAIWGGKSFVGAWTFTRTNEVVVLRAEWDMPDGKTALGEHRLSLSPSDILDPPKSLSPITITLREPARTPFLKPATSSKATPLPEIPTVLIAVSGDEAIRSLVHAHIESNLLRQDLRVTSVADIPVLYEKMQFGQIPVTWYSIKQLVPQEEVNLIVLAEVQKIGSTTLEYFGRTQEQTTASFSIRALDMATGTLATPPATGTVKFTALNVKENIREALNAAAKEMGPTLQAYWQDKRKASKP
jgi:serine/threonine protein kinase